MDEPEVIQQPNVPVNASVLVQARERVSLSLRAAAKRLNKLLRREQSENIRPDQIQAWEEGSAKPSLVEAECMAETYFIPFVDLFLDSLPSAGVSDFRLGPAGKSRRISYETLEKLNLFKRLGQATRRIATLLGVLEDVSIPELYELALEDDDALERAASEIRRALGISLETQVGWPTDDYALAEWRDAVERLGVFVFTIPMSVSECRGASRWEKGTTPTILVNSSDTKSAQVFTLIHELCHLVLRQSRTGLAMCDPAKRARNDEERLANRLAAAVILPTELVNNVIPQPVPSNDFNRWNTLLRKHLKEQLNVSYAVLGIRLKELGIVDKGRVPNFWRKPSKFVPRGKRTSRVSRYRRYMGPTLSRLMGQALVVEPGLATELARILDIKVKDVEGIPD